MAVKSLAAALLALMALPCAAARVAVRVTTYATPLESDFGRTPSERVVWRREGQARRHESLFVPGFASRDVEDPLHPGVYGAGMEGAGFISPELHQDDAALQSALKAGYRVLSLERWDEKTKTAYFLLTRRAVAADDAPLVAGRSAAVRRGDALFPEGRWVRLWKDGVDQGERLLHDECSSCEVDAHIDLYGPLDAPSIDGRWEAELLPPGHRPRKP